MINEPADNLRNRIVEWDFRIWSFTGNDNERYSVSIILLADGTVFGARPEVGLFTKVKSFKDFITLT